MTRLTKLWFAVAAIAITALLFVAAGQVPSLVMRVGLAASHKWWWQLVRNTAVWLPIGVAIWLPIGVGLYRRRVGDVQCVEQALLAHTRGTWRPVAMVIASAMDEVPLRGIPDHLYAERVRQLAASGQLEIRGDRTRMRYCEVRLPRPFMRLG
jgi:hypothetical protein